MTKILYLFAIAFAIWLAPFVSSVPFFNSEGNLQIDFILFKAIMVVVLAVTTYFSTRFYFQKFQDQSTLVLFASTFLIILVNIILDYFTVIQLSKLTTQDYFLQIGWIYLTFIPATIFLTLKTI